MSTYSTFGPRLNEFPPVEVLPHPTDVGFLALKDIASGLFVTVDGNDGTTRLSPEAHAWEQFLDGGNVWIAKREKAVYIFAKAGLWIDSLK